MRSCIKCNKKFNYASRFKLYEINVIIVVLFIWKNSKIAIWIANIIAYSFNYIYYRFTYSEYTVKKFWVCLIRVILDYILQVTIFICDFFIEYKEVY